MSRSAISIVVVWLVVVAVSLRHFTDKQGQWPFVVGWDVYGYYLYLPAFYPYQDHDTYRFTEAHRRDYKVSSNIYQISTHEGETLPIYTIGMALLYSPSYLSGHFLAGALGYPQDGLSLPYQWSLIVWAWIVAFIGLFYLRKLLVALYSDGTTAITLLALGLGSNLFNYWSHDPGLTHGWLFSCYAVLLYLIDRWYRRPTIKTSIVLGALSALIALIRPTEAILILLFAGYRAAPTTSWQQQVKYWLQKHKEMVVILATGIAVVSLQVLYWHINSGRWWFNAYAADGHHFDFAKPHIIDGLFSWRKGWLLYTPLMVLPFIGLAFGQKYKPWFWAVWPFVIVNIYIVLSWHMWWYAGSFGQRALVQSYAVLSIPLAATIASARRSKWLHYPTLLFIGCCILLNQWQNYQYRHKILPQDGITKTFYKASFWESDLDKSLRKYINSDERAPDGSIAAAVLGQKDFSSGDDTLGTLTVSPDRAFSPVLRIDRQELGDASSWLRIEADLLALSGNFGQYNGAKLVAEMKGNAQHQKWTGIEVQKILEVGQQQRISFDYQLPDTLSQAAYLQVMLWNTSPDSIYVKRLSVEALSMK